MHPRPKARLQPSTSAARLQLLTTARGAALRFTREPLWSIMLSHAADRMRALVDGWDGPGSGPIPEAIIRRAVQLTREALMGLDDPKAPHFAPGGDGSLQIEWHRAHAELEFCLGPDGHLDIWGRDHATGVEFEAEGLEALALFRRRAPWTAQCPSDGADAPPPALASVFQFAAE